MEFSEILTAANNNVIMVGFISGNKKYSAIRSQALDILELLIKKTENVGKAVK